MVLVDGSAVNSARHIGLEILDSQGNRVQSTVAELDGYYYFSDLLPGDYKLAVIPATVNTNRFELPEPLAFHIPPLGGFIEGPDIILERSEPAPEPLPVIAEAPLELMKETLKAQEIRKTDRRQEKPEPQPTMKKTTPPAEPVVAAAEPAQNQPETGKSPVETPVVPATAGPAGAVSEAWNLGRTALVDAPDFDEELTLSLMFEILYSNSLLPDEPLQ
jgi:hypothetical protein